MRIALCLLTWNELEGCRIDVPQLPLDDFDEVFAVDGGSGDGTVEFLRQSGIRVLRQPVPSLNAACAFAFESTSCDALVFFHPKGTVPPADTAHFRPLFEGGAEFIVASRNIPGGRNEEDAHLFRPRKWFVQALSIFLSMLWNRGGYRIRDVLHGFRGMTVGAFRRIGPSATGVTIDAEMVVGSYVLGLNRTEFPITEYPRISGATHFKALPTGWAILTFVWKTLTRSTSSVDDCKLCRWVRSSEGAGDDG